MSFYKYLWKFLTFLLILGVQSTVTQAIEIEGFISAIDSATAKRPTLNQQISFVQSLTTLLNTPSFTTSQYADTFAELSTYTQNKVLILQGNQTLAGLKAQAIKPSTNQTYFSLPNVDSERVRNAFLDWHNQERNSVWLPSYSYHSELERSAHIWSESLRDEARTVNTHTRAPDTAYYNVQSIKNWFAQHDVTFVNDVFSESVGRGYYKCNKADCTDDLLKAMRGSWDFFMSEKEKGGSHYRAIVSKQFSQIWIGISIDTARKRYYFVIHYGADLLQN